jgi:hypothetical protein
VSFYIQEPSSHVRVKILSFGSNGLVSVTSKLVQAFNQPSNPKGELVQSHDSFMLFPVLEELSPSMDLLDFGGYDSYFARICVDQCISSYSAPMG